MNRGYGVPKVMKPIYSERPARAAKSVQSVVVESMVHRYDFHVSAATCHNVARRHIMPRGSGAVCVRATPRVGQGGACEGQGGENMMMEGREREVGGWGREGGLRLQNDEASSRANMMPPVGEPKACVGAQGGNRLTRHP